MVHIIGFGGRTAVGVTAFTSAAAVRAAIAMFNEHSFMVDRYGERMIVAMDAVLSVDIEGVERFVELGLSAAQEALAPLVKIINNLPAIDVFIGLPSSRPGLPKHLNKEVSSRFSEQLGKWINVHMVETFNCGHSAGLLAVQEGWRKISEGAASVCLVGGIESYHEPETLEWLDEHDQLHSENNSWGYTPGEGAGFCLLCTDEVVKRYRLQTFGQILSAATAYEKNLIKTDTICLGEGLSAAVKQVIHALPSSDTKINFIICDMNGEHYRGDEFGYMVVRTGEYFVDPTDFMTPADCWGDVGAASGPLFIILALIAHLKSYSKGPYILVFTSSESGERTAILVKV